MANPTLTKAAIEFLEYRVEKRPASSLGLTPTPESWHVSVGYSVTTTEGEDIKRDLSLELKGAAVTQAKALMTTIAGLVKTQEGVMP